MYPWPAAAAAELGQEAVTLWEPDSKSSGLSNSLATGVYSTIADVHCQLPWIDWALTNAVIERHKKANIF